MTVDNIAPDQIRQLLSIQEVMAITGFSHSTIYRNVKLGKFPKPQKVCGSTRWRRSSIEALYTAETIE